MDINNYSYSEGPSIFYNDGFRSVIEAHVEFLRNHAETRSLYLEPNDVYIYEFDMYGLLMKNHIQPYMHWIVLRVNNLYSMTNFPKDLSELLIPSDGIINQLRQIYQTSNTVPSPSA